MDRYSHIPIVCIGQLPGYTAIGDTDTLLTILYLLFSSFPRFDSPRFASVQEVINLICNVSPILLLNHVTEGDTTRLTLWRQQWTHDVRQT